MMRSSASPIIRSRTSRASWLSVTSAARSVEPTCSKTAGSQAARKESLTVGGDKKGRVAPSTK